MNRALVAVASFSYENNFILTFFPSPVLFHFKDSRRASVNRNVCITLQIIIFKYVDDWNNITVAFILLSITKNG